MSWRGSVLARIAMLAVLGCAHAPPPAPTLAPETAAAVPPPEQPHKRVVVSDSIVELPPIKFFAGSPSLLPSSRQTLDAIAATLDGNPSILLVEVRADGADGPAALQQQLGNQRAQRIVDELVRRKVAPKRLVAHGVPTGARGVELEILRRAD